MKVISVFKSNFLRIMTNSLLLLFESIVVRMSGFVYTLMIARQFGIFEFGLYGSILSFLWVGMSLAEFGLTYVLTRDMAQQRNRSTELFSGAIIIIMPLFLVSTIGILMVATLFGYSRLFVAILAFGSIGVLGNVMVLLAGAVLRAFERMLFLCIVNSIVAMSSVIGGVVWLQCGAGILEIMLLFVVTPIVNAVILVGYIRSCFIHFSFAEGKAICSTLIKESVPLAIFGLCSVIVLRYDIIVLSKTRGMVDAGVFCAARNVTDTLSLVVSSVIGAAFPFIAQRWYQSRQMATKYYELTLRFFLIFAMAATMGVFVLADRIVILLYQNRYMDSVECLKTLIWAFGLNALGGPVSMILIITKEKLLKYTIYTVPIMLISVFMNSLLTPIYGPRSASAIAVMTSMLAFLVKVVVVRNILPNSRTWIKVGWRSLFASVVMGYVLYSLHSLPLPILIAVGLVAYVGTLFGLGEFRTEYLWFLRYWRGRET